jgi:RNA ligase (TIGR02306 family)
MDSNNQVIDAVQIVTIKDFKTLYKGEEPAEKIEQVLLEENDFSLVAQKGLYQKGDKAVYIQPDYNLPDIELFESFIRPNGDPKKTMLGSKNRIRAKSFNFHIGDNEKIYSVGILLPLNEVQDYITKNNLKGANLTEQLGITKYEEPDTTSGGKQSSGKPFPSYLYKTDEPNFNNVSNKMRFPCEYIGTIKTDGSSITIFDNLNESGICSRNLLKPMQITRVVGYRKETFFDKVKKIFGYKPDLKIYQTVENDDKFISLAKPYLEKLKTYCNENNLKIALRGEANGQNWKGSGNKNNPDAKNLENIKFFGSDDLSAGSAKKMSENEFNDICNALELNRCDVVFNQRFETKEDLIKTCNEYFKTNLVEGIVIRSLDSKFSCKFMSLEYDSKK